MKQVSKRVVAIVQARLSSQRLPGKVLMPLAGKPVLWHVLSRLKLARTLHEVIVATSVDASDDAIAAACEGWAVPCVRGSLDDVLSRYAAAVRMSGADVVVRIPSDKPLLDPDAIDALVEEHLASGADYTTNMGPGWPHDGHCPLGQEVEVASAAALLRADDEARLASDREHVMPYLYAREAGFSVRRRRTDNPLAPHEPRLNLDTSEDYALIRAIYDALPNSERGVIEHGELKRFLDAHPDLITQNAHVQQRSYT